MINLYQKVPCARCGNEKEKIDIFPRGLCLECHIKEQDGKPWEEIEKDIKNAFSGAIINL